MKVVLFCGGYGMRLREFSESVPKPLVPVGDRPLIWHVMKYYAHFGHKEFILCLGYQGHAIKRYFLDYDETVSNDFVMSNGGADLELLNCDIRDWKITFVDTGLESSIGERLRRVRPYLDGDEMFLANYSDGLTDFYLPDMVDRVERNGSVGGLLAVRPPYSFHVVDVDEAGEVRALRDLTRAELRINGGYFVLRREIFDHLRPGEDLVGGAFDGLIAEGRLTAWPYDGFWISMDTFKEKQRLDDMFGRGDRPWQVWREPHETSLIPAAEAVAMLEGAPRF